MVIIHIKNCVELDFVAFGTLLSVFCKNFCEATEWTLTKDTHSFKGAPTNFIRAKKFLM